MDRTAETARSLAREANGKGSAWLAFLDLICAVVAALLWALVPGVGPYPLALAAIPVAARLLVTGRLGRRTPFDAPLALFLVTAGLAVWSAYDRPAAWAKFWLVAGGILLYYALANATVLGTWRAWLPAVLGATLAIYFIMTNDWQQHPGEIAALTHQGKALQGLVPAIAGPRLNPNEAGGMLALLLPFAAWVTWDAWRKAQLHYESRLLLGLLGVAIASLMLCITLVGLLMTGSRGAGLALGVGFYTALSWFAAGRLAGQRPGRRLWAWIGLLVLGALVAALGAVALAGMGLWGTGVLSADSLRDRAGWYRYMLLLVKDYAFIGAGLDSFLMLYASYAMLLHVGYISNAHNLYLGVAIAQGIAGLLALLWAWATLAYLAWRQGGRGAGSSLAGIAALSAAVVLVHGCLESALYGTGVFLLFLPLAFALPDGQHRAETAGLRPKRAMLPAAGALLVLALVVVLVGPSALLAQIYANLGAVHQGQAELGLYSWPEWPVQDAVRQAVDLARPVGEFERALALAPGNGTANRRLGIVELSLGDYEDALRHLRAAYAAEPWSVTTRQLLGEALVVNGHLDEGRALWADVNNEQKQLELRASWYRFIGDERREAAVRYAALGK
jgi:tetratricopeptide (TPR) repeat protein